MNTKIEHAIKYTNTEKCEKHNKIKCSGSNAGTLHIQWKYELLTSENCTMSMA